MDHRENEMYRYILSETPICSSEVIYLYLAQLIRYETGMVRVLGSDRIRVKPRGGFTPRQLSRLFRGEQVPESQHLGGRIALAIDHHFASDLSLQQPVFVTVHVKLLRERRPLILPPPDVLPTPSSSRGASRDVFQRLAKEQQRVESKDLDVKNETQCSICIDDLSKTRGNIIKLPQCLHIFFYQNCLFKWLRRQNSCPLCRRAPYE